MPSIRDGRLRWVVYPNDHPPPHTHVIGPGWEIRIELTQPPSLLSIAGGPKAGEIARSLSGLGRRKRKSAPARIVFDDFAGQYLDIGQESGEKYTAAVDLQPTIPKSDRLLWP